MFFGGDWGNAEYRKHFCTAFFSFFLSSFSLSCCSVLSTSRLEICCKPVHTALANQCCHANNAHRTLRRFNGPLYLTLVSGKNGGCLAVFFFSFGNFLFLKTRFKHYVYFFRQCCKKKKKKNSVCICLSTHIFIYKEWKLHLNIFISALRLSLGYIQPELWTELSFPLCETI